MKKLEHLFNTTDSKQFEIANLAGIHPSELNRMRKGYSGLTKFRQLEVVLDELLPKDFVKKMNSKFSE